MQHNPSSIIITYVPFENSASNTIRFGGIKFTLEHRGEFFEEKTTEWGRRRLPHVICVTEYDVFDKLTKEEEESNSAVAQRRKKEIAINEEVQKIVKNADYTAYSLPGTNAEDKRDNRRSITLFFNGAFTPNHVTHFRRTNDVFGGYMIFTYADWKLLFVHIPHASKQGATSEIIKYFGYGYDAIIGDFNYSAKDGGLWNYFWGEKECGTLYLAEDPSGSGNSTGRPHNVGVALANGVELSGYHSESGWRKNQLQGKEPRIPGKARVVRLGDHREFTCKLSK